MATVGNSIKQKTSTVFCCEICDYVTERKSNFDNHLLTAKHQMATNGNLSWQQDSSNNFCCENCNKKYKDRTGLWKARILPQEPIPRGELGFSLNEFLGAVREKRRPKTCVVEHIKSLAVMLAAAESSRVGRAVDVAQLMDFLPR